MESQKVIRKELPVVACQTIDLLEAAVSRELQKKNPHATLRVGLLGIVALGLIRMLLKYNQKLRSLYRQVGS